MYVLNADKAIDNRGLVEVKGNVVVMETHHFTPLPGRLSYFSIVGLSYNSIKS